MHTIAAFLATDKGKDIFASLLIVIVGAGSFALGRLSVLFEERPVPRIEYPEDPLPLAASAVSSPPERSTANQEGDGVSGYVGSKNGNVFHYPWCPGARRIAPENLRRFDTWEAAEAAGYRPAANCPGLSKPKP